MPRERCRRLRGAMELPGDTISSVNLQRGFGSLGASIFGFHVPFACVPARRQKSCLESTSVLVTASV